jgi:hypothetical protein
VSDTRLDVALWEPFIEGPFIVGSPSPTCSRCERQIAAFGEAYRCVQCHALFDRTCIKKHFGWGLEGRPHEPDADKVAARREAEGRIDADRLAIVKEHRQCGTPNGYDGCYSHWPFAHCRADGMVWPCDVDRLSRLYRPDE